MRLQRNDGERGFALITVLLLLALLMTLLAGYFQMTRIEMATTHSAMDAFRGFYAAEAGLNLRGDLVRPTFAGYGRPSGTSPSTSGGQVPCDTGNAGSGDLGCAVYTVQDRQVRTWVEERPPGPRPSVIPRGEPFQNLAVDEYRYALSSMARDTGGVTEAVLEMHFNSRLVPLFQFAVFYDKDLEFHPPSTISLSGPVHSSGDLYLTRVDVDGQLTAGGLLHHGRKEANACNAAPIQVADPVTVSALPLCTGGRRLYADSDLAGWNGMIRTGVDAPTTPPSTAFGAASGAPWWDRADLRVVLDLNGSPAIQVRDAGGAVNALDSATLAACGAASHSTSLYDRREGLTIDMLDVDLGDLLDCIHLNLLLGSTTDLDEASDGGLVLYLGVDGPDSAGLNNYGVRLVNAAELAGAAPTAPDPLGLTLVTDQAIYLQGHFNIVGKKPAAVIADSVNVLSAAWVDADSTQPLTARIATDTTINAALLAGTDTSGGIEGTAGQDLGQYNGGLENFVRLHEDWGGRTLSYRGSLVSLRAPLHSDGLWVSGDPYYIEPARDWDYDRAFDRVDDLPPLTPRLTYLRQESFVRRFDL